MTVDATVAGNVLKLDPDKVSRALRRAKPGPIRQHAVEVGGVLFPVKEAFAEVTGLDLLDFNTNQARSIFRRLGFKVSRVS